MVAGFDKTQGQLSQADHVLAGALTGALVRCIFEPLDVLKIRFQLQAENRHVGVAPKYTGMLQATGRIWREEGFLALYKGQVAGQLLSITYTAVQFCSFDVFTALAHKYYAERRVPVRESRVHFLCGAASGVVATVVAQPLDILRTRLIAQGEPKTYRHLFAAVHLIRAEEGWLAFYKGLVPTVIQVAPQSGISFAVYRSLEALARPHPAFANNPAKSVVCGAIAGITAKALLFPLDTLKKRMQVIGFEKARHSFGKVFFYKGLLDCMSTIWRHEGLHGFYKGLWPSLVKAACTHGGSFAFYDLISNAIRAYRGIPTV